MQKFLVVLGLSVLVAVVVAKQQQFDGKEMWRKAFEFCKTSEEDQKAARASEKPSAEQARCLSKYLAQSMEMLKPDNTLDSDKIAQQFRDYERPVPEETSTMGGVDADTDEFANRFFAFTKKYNRDIKIAFHGDAEASF